MVSKRWFAESLNTRLVRWGAEPMGWRRIVTVGGEHIVGEGEGCRMY
jgi:hypothetical protein